MTLEQRAEVMRAARAHARAAHYEPADATLIPVFAATWLLLDKRGRLAPIDQRDLAEAGIGPVECAEVAALVGIDMMRARV